jgi:lysophospholipase
LPPACEEGRVDTSDGLALFVRRFRPEAPRAVLLVIHGLAEHSGRYRHVAERFASRGYAVYVPDLRAHGRSPGVPVHVDRFDEFVTDVAAVRARAASECTGLPLVLVGHSQGGLVALRSTLLDPGGLSGTILSSPLLGIAPGARPNLVVRTASRFLAVVAPRVRFPTRVDARLLSRDSAVGRAYDADPLVSHRASAGWYAALHAAMADAHARASALRVPILMMVSGDDAIVDPHAAEAWARRAPAGLVDFVRFDGFFHEMFNEPEKDRPFQTMDAWLAAACAR